MVKINQDFDHHRGDSRLVVISLPEPANQLVGWSARWWVGEAPDASGARVKLKKSPNLVANSDQTELQVSLLSSDLEGIAEGTYFHEASVTSPDGATYVVATGKLILIGTMS